MNHFVGYRVGFDKNLLDFSQSLRSCKSVEVRWNVLTRFAEKLGYEKGAYIILPKVEGHVEDHQPVSLTNHGLKWVEHYNNNQFYFKDPAMMHLLSGRKTDQLWSYHTTEPADDIDPEFFDDVRSAGLKFGVTIPLECANKQLVGGASFASCEQSKIAFDTQMAAKFLLLKSAVQLFHSHTQEISSLHEFFEFTPREHECLLWLSAGRTNKEIAHILNLSEKTVEHHIKRTCKKLHVVNRTHAVARAMSFQLLSP